MHIKNRL